MVADESPEDEQEAAAVLDFVIDAMADEEAGTRTRLSEYLRRFPEAEEAVAREFLRRKEPPRATTLSRAASSPQARAAARYEIIDVLGVGGQGRVFEAIDRKLGRRVALKRLESRRVTPLRLRRFQREAEAIARIDHPGIAEVLDASFDPDGDAEPFLVMRLIPGRDLAATLRERRTPRSAPRDSTLLPVPPICAADVDDVLSYFAEAARALHAAHEAGVVHRDVKPGNLMVRPDRGAVLLDFGLAFVEDEETLTVEGSSLGTPEYMAPEQIARGSEAADRRSDLYSLGVSLCECLTGERPFRAATGIGLQKAIAEGHTHSPVRRQALVKRDLAIVVETAMDVDPKRRYPTALELAEDLDRVRRRESILARAPSAWSRVRRFGEREPRLAVALAVLFSTLVAGLALAIAGIRMRDGLIAEKVDALAAEQRARDYALAQIYATRAQSLLADDEASALASALEAVRLHPDQRSITSLYAPLEACRLERRLDAAGANYVFDAAVDEAGARLAALADDGAVWLWALDAKTPPERFEHGVSGARSLAWSTDLADILVRPSSGAGARLDLATRTARPAEIPPFGESHDVTVVRLDGERVELRIHGKVSTVLQVELRGVGALHAATSPDGGRIAVTSAPGGLLVVDSGTGEVLLRQRSRFVPTDLQWSPNGERVVVASASESTFVWSMRPPDELRRLPGAEVPVLGAWFLDGGGIPVVARADGSLTLHREIGSMARGVEAKVRAPRADGAPSAAWRTVHPSRSGRRFVTRDDDGALRAWTITAGLEVVLRAELPAAHPSSPLVVGALASSVAWVDDEGHARVWSVTGGAMRDFGGATRLVALDNDERFIALARESGAVEIEPLADPDRPAAPPSLEPPLAGGPERRVTAMAFDPEGGALAVGYDPGVVFVFDLDDESVLAGPIMTSRHDHLAWAEDGGEILVTRVHAAGSVRVIDPRLGTLEPHRVDPDAGITDVTIEAPGSGFVAACADGSARLFRRPFEPWNEFPLHAAPLTCVRLDGAGRALTGDTKGVAYLWPGDPRPMAAARAPHGLDPWDRWRSDDSAAD